MPGNHFLSNRSFWGVSLPICAALLIFGNNFRVLAFFWSGLQINVVVAFHVWSVNYAPFTP